MKTVGPAAVPPGAPLVDPAHVAALVTLTALAVLLRAAHLFQPMRYDESFSFMRYAAHSFETALTNYSAPNNHLLHTALMRVAYLLAGDAPWALRLPALLAGVMLVPATYLFARRLASPGVALVAAALAASSSPLILYSTNSRGYSLLALAFLGLVILGFRLEGRRTWRRWAAFVLLTAVGFWTVPTMLFGFGGVVVWLSVRAWKPAEGEARPEPVWLVVACAAAGVITLFLYDPVIRGNGFQALVGNRYVTAVPFGDFVRESPRVLAVLWRSWHAGVPLWVQPLLGAGALLFLAPLRRQGREPLRFIAAVLAWCALLLLFTRRHPFERVWLFLLPVYLTASAAGWAALLRGLPARWPVFAHRAVLPVSSLALAALLGWRVVATESVLRSEETGRFVEAEPVAQFLAARYREPGRILIYAGDAPASEPFTYYWRRQGLQQQVQDATPLRRVFVVVGDGDERRAAAILAREGMPPEGFSPLAVAFRVGPAAVFVSHPPP